MAREEERTRVSRDLHDQIGQILTAIKMDLTWASKRLPDGDMQRRLNESIELVNEGVRSVRTICSGLRPGVLDDLGLSAAIEWQANEFTARTGIACEVSVPAFDLNLAPDQRTAFFRIFQEALTNIARHAQASRVQADLYMEDRHLVLEVSDNGKGFSPAEVSGSLGILGMRERARACGGEFQLTSSPNNGAALAVRIPLSFPKSECDHSAECETGPIENRSTPSL
jgi:signal transduction histidine kinase